MRGKISLDILAIVVTKCKDIPIFTSLSQPLAILIINRVHTRLILNFKALFQNR